MLTNLQDAELEQASTAITAKVCFFPTKINIAQDLVLHCAVSIAVGLTHHLAQDEALATKDAELEQASTAITAKVCFFRTISLSQRG